MQQISKIICSTYVTNGHVKRQRRKTLTVLQRTCSPKGKVQHSFLSRFLSLSSSRALSWPTFAQLSEATGLLAFTVNRLQPWLIMFRCLGIVVYFYSPYSTVSFWVPLSFFASFFFLSPSCLFPSNYSYAWLGRIAAINLFVVHICLGRLLLGIVAALKEAEPKRGGD